MGARDQIRQRFNELSPALQQVARYVLDHPNEVVTALDAQRGHARAEHARHAGALCAAPGL
jgi:hypothetical protein